MATQPTQPEEQRGNALSNLSERERKLLTLMLGNFVFLGLAVSVYMFQQSLAKTEAEIAQYQEALDALTEYGPKYLAMQREAEQGDSEDDRAQLFTGERLKKNDLQLTSFLATHASAVNIKVDNYDEDQLPLSTGEDDGPIITEMLLKVDIREAKMSTLMQMLERIEESREPVIIKRINIRDRSKKPGYVRAYITVSTYVQKDQES